ncbi:hypothetical protein ACHAPT_011723 [Fusarium lateritium]
MASLNPTPKCTIRLVTLLPGQDGEPLRCGTQTVDVNDKVPYEALSYVWGPYRGHTIEVDGQTVDITVNLFEALNRLRNLETPRALWVDQISASKWGLDKSKQGIKAQQQRMGMMRSVYRNCSRSLIWLGDIGEGQDLFTLQDATALFDFLKMHAARETDKGRFLQAVETCTRPTSYEGVCNAFKSMGPHGNIWWHRIWTVQEVILPPDAAVQWGPLTISWTELLGAATSFNHSHGYVAECPDLDGVADAIGEDFGYLAEAILDLRITSKREESPLMTLRRYRNRSSTDTHDKVYALMGILDIGAFPSVLTGDYTELASVLYTRVSLDIIRLSGGLEPLIGMRGGARVTPNLPSWVFDMSVLDDGRSSNWFDLVRRYERFCASGNESLKMEVSDDERVLTLEGVYLDRVEHVSEVMADGSKESTGQDFNDTLDAWEMLLNHVVQEKSLGASPTGLSWKEVFCRTVVGDLIFAGTPARRVSEEDCGLFWQFRRDLELNETWRSVQQMVSRQAFFITKLGYIGIGPLTTRVGDGVWVLLGGKMPFVLGDEEIGSESDVDGFRKVFVGEAYVHGFMHGEAIESSERPVGRVSLM